MKAYFGIAIAILIADAISVSANSQLNSTKNYPKSWNDGFARSAVVNEVSNPKEKVVPAPNYRQPKNSKIPPPRNPGIPLRRPEILSRNPQVSPTRPLRLLKRGIELLREQDRCSSSNEIFDTCPKHESCQPTCQRPNVSDVCLKADCKPGCVCKKGMVKRESDNRCVTPAQCPLSEGSPRKLSRSKRCGEWRQVGGCRGYRPAGTISRVGGRGYGHDRGVGHGQGQFLEAVQGGGSYSTYRRQNSGRYDTYQRSGYQQGQLLRVGQRSGVYSAYGRQNGRHYHPYQRGGYQQDQFLQAGQGGGSYGAYGRQKGGWYYLNQGEDEIQGQEGPFEQLTTQPPEKGEWPFEMTEQNYERQQDGSLRAHGGQQGGFFLAHSKNHPYGEQ